MKQNILLSLLASAVVLCLPVAAMAQEAPKQPLHQVLQGYQEKGGVVEYMGHSNGLDGWVVINPKGGVQYAYTNNQGGLVIGMMFDETGNMVTQEQVKAYAARLDGSQAAAPGADKAGVGSKSEQFYAEMEKRHWVTVGEESAPYMYVMINTTCPHCHEYWEKLQDPIKNGELQVRLVPFGNVKQNRDTGAALLSVDNPAQAWSDFINGDKEALGADKIADGAYDKMDANTQLWADWKLPQAPFTVYRKPDGGDLMVIAGVPENMMRLRSDFLK